MTNKFAIKVLTELRGYGDRFANIGFDRKEAIDLAIKALEQQPCEDCISRKETIEWLKKVTVTDGITFKTGFEQILYDIEQMPSVTPQQKWIPCSERLPKKDETEVLITLKEDGSVLQATYLDDRTFDTEAYGWFAIKDISAWMPLPDRYKESEDAK